MRWTASSGRGLAATAIAAAIGLAAVTPAPAQFSPSYNFLKAVRDGDGAKAKSLIDAPGSIAVDTRDSGSGETALHIVVRRRDLPWMGFLLTNHANPDIRDSQGDTPLLVAAQIGYEEGAQLLLQIGAQANLPNGRGETPLIIAVQTRNLAMVRLLISGGADPNITDHVTGQSAYDYARADPRGTAIVRVLDEAKPRAAHKMMGPSQ